MRRWTGAWTALAGLLVGAIAAAAQDVPKQAPPAPPLKGSQIDGQSNTTTIVRPTAPERRNAGQVTFTAHLTEESTAIDSGLVWRVYRDKPGADGKLVLLSTHRDAAPQLRLDVGDYMVNAAFGRANLTKRVSIALGKTAAEKFVLSAGGLRVTATLASGEAVGEGAVQYAILSDERDQFGNRIPVMTGAKPGAVVRLNAGIYQVHSIYGDANASVRGEVTVEPGKITDATLSHAAARVTFRLVSRGGGEALADTQWTLTGGQGEVVKESTGAIPTHVLAPGNYVATAKRQGLAFKRDFSVQAGDNVYVEVVANP